MTERYQVVVVGPAPAGAWWRVSWPSAAAACCCWRRDRTRRPPGLFDEVQDAHMVYPITAHCMKFRHDVDGGFVVEAATVQDSIGFATGLCDEQGMPLWRGARADGTPLSLFHGPVDAGQR
jgi:hypothetical protein